MLALWGAMKSVLRPGDRVLAVATGVFGYGFADMARQLGAEVEVVGFGYDAIVEPGKVRDVARRFRPRLVTLVHCETPSGTLNPLDTVGAICREVDALYYVDFVASAGGTPVLVDEWGIDLGLLGSQKVLSLMPDLSMVSLSERAWAAVAETDYVGYDALAPWKTAIGDRYMPYTHNWHALAGLEIGLKRLHDEGLEAAYARHAAVAQLCRDRLKQMGVDILPVSEAACSPTVTAARVPAGLSWTGLDRGLRDRGMAVGGSYGPLAGKVFRIGHMGSQADATLVTRGMNVLEEVLARAR
jgi:aspartate aminotransferase-like enzyme